MCGLNSKTIFTLVQDRVSKDPELLAELRKNGRLIPSDMYDKDEEWLYLNLSEAGIPLTHEELDELVERETSCFDIYEKLQRRHHAKIDDRDYDRLLLCVMELCRRYYPTWASVDNLDDRMQEGYDLLYDWSKENRRKAVDVWGEAWRLVTELAHKWQTQTVDAFDNRFEGYQFVSNWVQDYDMGLVNVAHDDPSYHAVRERFAREFDQLFPGDLHPVLSLYFDADGNLEEDRDGFEFDESWQDDDAEANGWISSLDDEPVRTPVTTIKVGRNDPCPCGSGKKYKKCCGRPVGMR